MSARVGIYGGTFNPIHVGHLRAAEEVAERLELERVVFVPSGQPPHKRGDGADDPIAPAAERLAWVRDAIACNARFELSSLEVEREGPSYLIDTLEALGHELSLGRESLLFILGRDAFQEMGDWREPRRLLTLANFAVTTRPPVRTGSLREWLPECVREDVDLEPDGLAANHREAGTRIELVPITALDVSATDLRARVRTGRSLRYLVPEVVRESIEKSNAYASQHAVPMRSQT